MSYDPTANKCMISGMAAGPRLFKYSSNDAHGAVDAADYFTDGAKRGMRVGDVVIVEDIDTGTVTLHCVSEIDADGNGTITAATLA